MEGHRLRSEGSLVFECTCIRYKALGWTLAVHISSLVLYHDSVCLIVLRDVPNIKRGVAPAVSISNVPSPHLEAPAPKLIVRKCCLKASTSGQGGFKFWTLVVRSLHLRFACSVLIDGDVRCLLAARLGHHLPICTRAGSS